MPVRPRFTHGQEEGRDIAQNLSRFRAGTQIFGLYRGICEDNRDPQVMCRVRVRIHEFHGINPLKGDFQDLDGLNPEKALRTYEIPWALPCLPPSQITVPAIGDQVWVGFEKGDLNSPIWFGVYPIAPQRINRAPQPLYFGGGGGEDAGEDFTMAGGDVTYWKGNVGISRRMCRKEKYQGPGDRSIVPLEMKTDDRYPNGYGWRYPRGTVVDVIEEEGKAKILIMDINRNVIKIETEDGIARAPVVTGDADAGIIRQAITKPTNVITLYAGKWQDFLAHEGEGDGDLVDVSEDTEGGADSAAGLGPARIPAALCELRMIGEKRVLIQSEGILDVFVKKDATVIINGNAKVGVSGDMDLTVDGDMKMSVGGDFSLSVGGDTSMKSSGDFTIGSEGSLSMTGMTTKLKGVETLTVASNISMTIETLGFMTINSLVNTLIGCIGPITIANTSIMTLATELLIAPEPTGESTGVTLPTVDVVLPITVPDTPTVPDIPDPPVPKEVHQKCI